MPSRSPRSEVDFQGIEPLEPRLLLSAVSPTVELFQGITPLFVENQGQWSDAGVRYAFSSGGVSVAFTDTGLRFQIAAAQPAQTDTASADPLDNLFAFGPDDLADATWITTEFSLSFAGAHAVSPVGVDLTPTRNNYLLGSQDQWRTDVPTYHGVAYYGLYDGVDLFITGQAGQLKYEFHVAPPASDSDDPAAAWQQIQLDYDGVAGLSLTDDGGLWIDLLPEGLGHLTDQAPVIYQDIDGQRVDVAGHFDLRDSDAYGFTLTQAYDASRPLVLDPELAWSSYTLGLSQGFVSIALDAAGNVLATGSTQSYYWVKGGYDTSYGGSYDACVVKLSPTGEQLWSTYLGGSYPDHGYGIAVDAEGNVLATGTTYSVGWVSGGYKTSKYDTDSMAFAVKLSPTGGHLWSTYIGKGFEEGEGIAVDSLGNVLVMGTTHSSNWVKGGYDTSYGGNSDAFVFKITPTGEHLWSTFIGGTAAEQGLGIAVDSWDNVLVTGYTYTSEWVSGGYDTSNNGRVDAFAVKISPTGEHLWSTCLGGDDTDWGYAIAADAEGNVLVTGRTSSAGWVSGGYDTSYNGTYSDAFAVKISPTGEHLWSTYLGGANNDVGYGIGADAQGNVLVTGLTGWLDGVSGGPDTSFNGGSDAFVVKLLPTGAHLWSTYLGGSKNDWGQGIALDGSGNILVAGWTESSSWVSGGRSGFGGGFVVKIADAYEPNDTFEQAVNLGTGDQHLTDLALLSNLRDTDYFRWTASYAGVVRMRVTSTRPGVLDTLSVKNNLQQILAVSHNQGDTSEVRMAVTPGQVLYLAVGYGTPEDLGSRPYTLDLWESVPGDYNHDGYVNVQDINPYVAAMTDASAYMAMHPDWDLVSLGDLNHDGWFNVQDINPFVQLLADTSSSSGTATSLNLPATDSPAPAPATAPITAPVAPAPLRFAPLESATSHASAKPWWTPAKPMFENLGRSAWLWEHWSAMFAAAESAT